MGNSEDAKLPKSEKSSSPAPEQGQQSNNVHVYPDWAAMQACYGPRLPVPPYYNSAVASGHPPRPFMWGPPQAMVPPYGNPYAAFYAPGGVYAHPGVPLGAHSNGHVISPSAAVTEATAGVPLSIDAPAKSAKVNADQGLMNKLKGFDGLAMSIGNGNGGSAGAGADNGVSQSEDTDGSSDGSDGSDGNTAIVCQIKKKRSREGTPDCTREGKSVTPKSTVHSGDVKGTPSKVMRTVVAPGSDTDKSTGDVISPKMTTALELRNSSGGNLKSGPIGDGWLQNERELKRERRKQSNRESARRSRMRKQAEAEDLAKKVRALDSENLTLKSEMNKLADNCAKLRVHNAAMLEKMKTARLGPVQPVGTVNLLARVNNSGAAADRTGEEGEGPENLGSRATKLHQLLDASPRADAVAAR